MNGDAVEEKMDKNLGVKVSNPVRDCYFSKISERQKPTILKFKHRRNPIKMTKKNVRALTGFGEVKRMKNDNYYV